jgi:hypothetical protein
MKRVLLFVASLVGAASLASASTVDSYTAIGDPGQPNNAVDMNSVTSTVWTVTTAPGASGVDGSGSGFYAPNGPPNLGNAWQLYSYQNDGTGNGGSAFANTTFAGGPLTIGQTVSIGFEMRALDPTVGFAGMNLLNGSGNAITFYIYGGGPGNYFYTDAGTNGANAGPLTYQYQDPMVLNFTVTGAGTYSAIVSNSNGTDSWTGTFSGSLVGMQMFDSKGGNGSDVGFNNLSIVPEPNTIALVVSGLAFLGFGVRRRARRS